MGSQLRNSGESATAESDPAAPRPPALGKNRDFLLLWGGQTISEVGSQITVLALPLVALVVLHASTLQVTLLATAQTCAYLLVSLPAGILVDRVAKGTLMVWCDVGRLVLIGSIPVARLLGLLTLGQLYVVALSVSVMSVFFSVAYPSYVPTLLRPEQFMDGNGKLGTSQSLAQIVGPGLGAGLVGLLGAAGTMVGDALSYAASAGTLLAIRTPEPPPVPVARGERPKLRSQIREGLAYVIREPIIRAAVAWNGTANFFVIMVESLGPIFLVRTLHLSAGYVGLLLAMGAVGGVAGGLAAGGLARRIGSSRVTWLSMTVFALPGLLIPMARPDGWVVLFALGWTSWTFSSTVCGVGLLTYRQTTCPPELLPRVNATARWISWGTLPLGSIVGGVLGSVLGLRPALWVATIGGCAAGLWLFFSPLRGLRDIPSRALSPAPAF